MDQPAGAPAHPPLDNVARAIIEQLVHDGRRSYASIGKEVGLSEAAVRQRVQRLTESGVMRIVAVTDPVQIGLARQAMVGVTVSGSARKVAAALAGIDEVDHVAITTGRFDILAEVACQDDARLLDLVGDRIATMPGVMTTETFVHLEVAKQRHSRRLR